MKKVWMVKSEKFVVLFPSREQCKKFVRQFGGETYFHDGRWVARSVYCSLFCEQRGDL